MVAAGFPIVKLAGLVIKQISKPIATVLKTRAKNSHFFRTKICMPPAQLYHWGEVRMKMYVMNIGKTGEKMVIPKLNEEAAIELGANLLGEGVVLFTGILIITFEYMRGVRNDKKKQEAEFDERRNLENRVTDLTFAAEELDTKVRELTRLLYTLESKLFLHQLGLHEKPESAVSLPPESSIFQRALQYAVASMATLIV